MALCIVAQPTMAREADGSTDTEEMAVARSIIEVMFPPTKRDEMMHDLMTEVLSQFTASVDLQRITDTGLRSILEKFLDEIPDNLMPQVREHLPRMMEATATAYAREFSMAELQDIQPSTALMSDPAVAAANSEYFSQLRQLNEVLTAEPASGDDRIF